MHVCLLLITPLLFWSTRHLRPYYPLLNSLGSHYLNLKILKSKVFSELYQTIIAQKMRWSCQVEAFNFFFDIRKVEYWALIFLKYQYLLKISIYRIILLTSSQCKSFKAEDIAKIESLCQSISLDWSTVVSTHSPRYKWNPGWCRENRCWFLFWKLSWMFNWLS